MLQRMETLLKEQPNAPINYMYIGILNERLGDKESAQSNYLKAIELDPTFGLAYYNLSHFAYRQAVDEAKAAKVQTAGIQVSGSNGINKDSEPLDLGQAIAYCNYALQIYPNSAFLYYNRANYYSHSQQFIKAVEDYDKAISLQNNFAEAYYNRGLTLLLLKDNETACPSLSKAGELGLHQAYNLIKRYCSKTN